MIRVSVFVPKENNLHNTAMLVTYYFWLVQNIPAQSYKINERSVDFENHEDALAFKMKFGLYGIHTDETA